ncbi:unnamed protein product [Pylaiella littoralis]
MSSAQSVPETPKRKNLNDAERSAVIVELHKGSNNGVLRKGDFTRVALLFGTNRWTIAGLWKEYGRQKDAGVVSPDLHNKRRGKSGQKGVNLDSLRELLKGIPIKNRTTIRGVAAALGIPRSTLHRNLKNLGLHAVSCYLKLLLTDNGKKESGVVHAVDQHDSWWKPQVPQLRRPCPPRRESGSTSARTGRTITSATTRSYLSARFGTNHTSRR